MNKPAKLWPHVVTTLVLCNIALVSHAGIETLHRVWSDPTDLIGSVAVTLTWLYVLCFLSTALAVVGCGRCVVIVWRRWWRHGAGCRG